MSQSSAKGSTVGRPKVDFQRPPVVETVMALQFAPLKGWSVIHLGLFWDLIRQQYPRYQIQPPISSEIELRLGIRTIAPGASPVDFGENLPVRAWFFDRSETRLIQLQNNAFIHNWRKTAETQPYQHYDVIKPIFQDEWNRFKGFLRDKGLPEPQVWQCEVTYVNHIVRGEGWDTLAELADVITFWGNEPSTGFLPAIQAGSFAAVFPMSDGSGHLHVIGQPAVRKSDSKEILQINVSARGKPRSTKTEDVFAWLDLGHDWVVHGFKDVTTQKMHRIWGVR